MRLFTDTRVSLATVCAVWISLFGPTIAMVAGVVLIGGGLREAGAVFFAATLFSAADVFGMLVRMSGDAEGHDRALAAIFDLPMVPMARALSARYL
ncbi:hypothetical protein [Parvularcula lutaonensis]|uniref:Uncharacterized protein n=1 Tax=Parvularcula lutaonensis TaxID=491923 RepID=A0ABV7MEF4_9PROT|nr:hypothetical protein [Parvularcula lutaonensis]